MGISNENFVLINKDTFTNMGGIRTPIGCLLPRNRKYAERGCFIYRAN